MVEIMVAAVVGIMVLVAAADLLGQLTLRSAAIRTEEQTRMVAYQVNERMRAYSCGLVFGSESDLATRGANCENGLTTGGGAPVLGTCATPDLATTQVFGDVNLCWTGDGRKYDVAVTTWWEISTLADPTCPTTGTKDLPDTFARSITVTPAGGTATTVVVREAAPPNALAFGTKFFRGSGSQTVLGVPRSAPTDGLPTCAAGRTLFPLLPTTYVGGGTSW